MIELNNINYKYPSAENNSLTDFNLRINAGELVVLCGRSGCGKTTVTRLLNGLIPHFYDGILEGEIIVDGFDTVKTELSQIAKLAGSVFQNPKSQFFNVDTDGELAFGCENMALPRELILQNIKKAVRDLELDSLLGRNIFHLSGGEKQQIACGSVYATNPQVYVLDEPSSNMDVKSIERLKRILEIIKKEKKTIIISEHRLYYLMELADRFIYIQDGKVVQSFSSKEIKEIPINKLESLGLRTPDRNEISYRGNREGTIFEKSAAIEIQKLQCSRGRHEVLNISDLQIPKHSVVAIIGENGAGKSTFIEILSGFLKHKGIIKFNGNKIKRSKRAQHSYMIMQDVNRQLFCSSVSEEVSLGLPEEKKESSPPLLEEMELSDYKDRHPATLSGGQKQRVAICAALGAEKEFMFYDEPTSGLDFIGMNHLCKFIKKNAETTSATFVITHDYELVMGSCTHILHLNRRNNADFYELDEPGIGKLKDYFIRA